MARYKLSEIEFDELFIDRSITKTPCLCFRDGGKFFPVMYLKKAKGIPDAFYETILRGLAVKVKREGEA